MLSLSCNLKVQLVFNEIQKAEDQEEVEIKTFLRKKVLTLIVMSPLNLNIALCQI